jgi:hypothetical protein
MMPAVALISIDGFSAALAADPCAASLQGRTMRSISTEPPSARAVTPTVVRAGNRPGAKWRAYSAFTAS